MQWIDLTAQLRNPVFPFDLPTLSESLLPVTGTLLGLVYAGLIYWFQGALERFEYSRDLLEDMLTADGRLLLDLLVGASLVGLFGLIKASGMASLSFWIFGFVITIDATRVIAARGYFTTIFSSRFIPAHYGRVRAYLRQIKNAGLINSILPSGIVALAVIYPLWVSSAKGLTWSITDAGASIFLLSATGFSMIQVRSLLTDAMTARKISEKYRQSQNQKNAQTLSAPEVIWSDDKRDLERRILSERLERIRVRPWAETDLHGLASWTSRDLTDLPVLCGPPWVKEDGSCHLNITVPYLPDDVKSREFIILWSRRILEIMADSNTAVQQFSLSFFRKDSDGEPALHFAMIRAGKSDVLATKGKGLSDLEFLKKMPGRFFEAAIA